MAVDTRVGIRELDLTACNPHTLSDKINSVPGLKTSTGKPLSTLPPQHGSRVRYVELCIRSFPVDQGFANQSIYMTYSLFHLP